MTVPEYAFEYLGEEAQQQTCEQSDYVSEKHPYRGSIFW